MVYRLLALDLDGTLLTRTKRITPRTRRALDQAVSRGSQIVVATGRGIAVVRHFCAGLTLTAPQITFNGAVIYDPLREQAVWQYLLPPAYALPGLEFFIAAGVLTAYFTPHDLYLDQRMPQPRNWLPGSEQGPELVDDMRSVAADPCIKIVGHADPPNIAHLRPLAVERFGRALYVTQTAPDLLELLHPEVSKGAALRRIAHMLHVPREEIVAFGDSHNDIDMLDFAGVGIAMGNASAEVRAVADLVTESNEDDGIAQALQRLDAI